MKKEKRNKLTLIILTILILLFTSITATFAYFTATGTSNVINRYKISTPVYGRAYTSSGGNINLEVSGELMHASSASSVTPAAVAKIDDALSITVETSSEGGTTTCNYDIVYEPNVAYMASAENVSNSKEFTIKIESNLQKDITGEVNLNNVTEKIVLADNLEVEATGISLSKTEVISAEVSFYNQIFNQDDNKDITFGGRLYIEDLTCETIN